MITIDTLMMDMNKSDCDEIRLLQGYLSPTFITQTVCVYVCVSIGQGIHRTGNRIEWTGKRKRDGSSYSVAFFSADAVDTFKIC